jgi:hypothetical protein
MEPIFKCNICLNTFRQKKNLQIHLKERRCKSELVKDLTKLHEFLDLVQLQEYLNNHTTNKNKDDEKDKIIDTLSDININDNMFNIHVSLKDDVKSRIDVEKLKQSINKTIEKACKVNNYTYKKYIFPSGKSVNYQGYENFALDELCKVYSEEDIENDRKHIPNVKYTLKNKLHYYYPDIYIKSKNLIIEVKSNYTYKQHLIRNIIKSLAVKKAGYNFEFWIYSDKAKTKIII